MARSKKQEGQSGAPPSSGNGKLPITQYTGINATGTKTVLVSALLEVTGQVRFGDGTDIATTITEKDTVLGPNGSVEKAIWAGTKRRGVDRRTIHEFRNQLGWDSKECYVGNLCMECPICWLYGFTGTTQQAQINARSRVLYATSVSLEDTSRCLNRHSRNQVDEKSQTTAGAAGIHEEEMVIAGTHFPVYTSLIHVLDWEIGVFAHAFLENLNANRYSAASRAQGGMRFVEHNNEPVLVVDESSHGVFPLSAPKLAGWETDFRKAVELFVPTQNSPISLLPFQAQLQKQGFAVESGQTKLAAKGGGIELTIEVQENALVVHQGSDELMNRYYGSQALGYLRQKQVEAQKKLADSSWRSQFQTEAKGYAQAIQGKGAGTESAGSPGADSNVAGDESNKEESSGGDE
ncbi:MAG: type I-D CRISPR-associated protein Cas7/Csc2 [Acidobacteriota bacterium]